MTTLWPIPDRVGKGGKPAGYAGQALVIRRG